MRAITLLNYAEVREVLDAFPNVILWLNGHDHRGSYGLMNEGQQNERHHLTLKGMQSGEDRYYRLEFYPDRIVVLRAERSEPERVLPFAPPARYATKPQGRR